MSPTQRSPAALQVRLSGNGEDANKNSSPVEGTKTPMAPLKDMADIDVAVGPDRGVIGIGGYRVRAEKTPARAHMHERGAVGQRHPEAAVGRVEAEALGRLEAGRVADRHGELTQCLAFQVHVHDDARSIVHVTKNVEGVVRSKGDVE